jgi:PadR family transcriptional regulator, regulatory protein AphA
MFCRLPLLGGMGMSLEAAILGFLAEEPRSGYDLKTRCFAEQAKAFWTADQAQIYRTLDRLQAAKLVTCTRKRQLGKPDRKVYRLTHAGQAELGVWLASHTPATPPRDSFLLQLYFSAALGDAEIASNLRARRGAHQARLEALRREVIAPAEGPAVSDRSRLLRDAAFDGAIARERASIDWLDDTIEAIEAGRLPAPAPDAASDEQFEAGSA